MASTRRESRATNGKAASAFRRRDLEASYEYCRRLSRRTAKNFYYSFLALPAAVRRDMCALYAYMRICDDLGDEPGTPIVERRAKLISWRSQVTQALVADATSAADGDAEAPHPVLPALADMVRRRNVPVEPLLSVIDGVEMDLDPQPFATFDDLAQYCYHVAGTVGLCCIHVWGFRGESAPSRAVECGLAFQLTNMLRDLGEDAAMGRIYLPVEDLERFNYGPGEIAAGVVNDRFRRLMAFQVERARHYYRESAPLAADVDSCGRPVLAAMRSIYGGLLDEIERRNYDVYRSRVALPRWKKLTMTARAMMWAGR